MHPQRWGDPDRAGDLPEEARGLVELALGPLAERPAVPDAAPAPSTLGADLLEVLGRIAGPDHVHTDDATRRLRTRGKSTPDLLRARAGDLSDAPDAVVRPGTHDQVLDLIRFAQEHEVALVPFGGGTSVTGGLVARRVGYAGVLSLDLGRMAGVPEVDPVSMTATLEAGLRGPEAEALLAEHGLTLGHFPQSFEHASIGGFAATRSSGQSSAGYGRFDAMVVGLRVATSRGTLEVGRAPASAAGPDLRQLFLGSEGTLGVITAVTVRVRARPEVRAYEGWRWESFDAGAEAVRSLAQSGLLPTVVRLSDEAETAINLAHPDAIGGEGSGGCLMVVGHEGTSELVDMRRTATTAALERLGGTPLGAEPGEAWARGRFDAPYLRDSLLDLGLVVETLETATFWSRRDRVYAAVKAALVDALGEDTIVLCHVSHVYETGCSLYFTVAARGGEDPIGRWQEAKAAASDAMIEAGATITHHHAVGSDHRAWFAREIGPVGVDVLRAIKAELDPTGVLNPGVMVP